MRQRILASILLLLYFQVSSADTFQYLGCYKASSIQSILTYNNDYTFQSSGHCETECLGSKIAALIDGDKCYCGASLPDVDADDDDNCSVDCNGYPQDSCGDNGNYFSVYQDEDVESEDIVSSSSADESSSTSTSSSSSSSSSPSSTIESTTASPSTTTQETTESSQVDSTTQQIASSSSSPQTTSSAPAQTTTSASPSSSLVSPSTPSSSAPTTSMSSSSTTPLVSSVRLVTITKSNSQVIVTRTASASAAADLSGQRSSGSRSLSGGAIAGIVIGVIAGVLLIAALILFFCWRQRRQQQEDENGAYDNSDQMIQNFVQKNAMNLKNRSSNSTLNDFIDDEKIISDDSYIFGLNDDTFTRGKRRFSDGSLPDARQNTNGKELRVTNPDI